MPLFVGVYVLLELLSRYILFVCTLLLLFGFCFLLAFFIIISASFSFVLVYRDLRAGAGLSGTLPVLT